MHAAVEFVEVHRRPELRGLSFAAPAQGVTAVTGGSPGLQSLVFRMVCGLDVPDGGAVLVLGRDISRARKRERRQIQRRMGVVFGGEDLGLFADATARENVAIAVGSAGRVGRKRRRAAIDAALQALDLSHLADALPADLTGPQRKRLALARALALRAPLVVADAFDHGCDGDESAALAEFVAEDGRRRGTAALLAVREADLAARIADEIIDLSVLVGR
jgi:ABC-type transporter Mla maintaining outer membrane lipid asymmetry ATPase subunit MlaF